MKILVKLYDVTGRDGTQDAEFKLPGKRKFKLAVRLDAMGFHYFEGGWPGANAESDEFFTLAARHTFSRIKVAAFGSTGGKNLKVESDPQVQALLRAKTPIITIYGKSSLWQVQNVLRCSPEENLRMITDTVAYLRAKGRTVFYDAEHGFDGFKYDAEYARATWCAAREAGAEAVILCDTNGGTLPREIAKVTREAVQLLPGCEVGIHPHNDCGIATANALAAVEAGARQVQGTINGYGERGTNLSLLEAAANLQLKMGYHCLPARSLRRFTELSQFVDELGDMQSNPRRPFFGDLVFSHNGGRHAHAVGLNANSYQHIDPEHVGNRSTIIVSGQSGKASIALMAKNLGLRIRKEKFGLVLDAVKRQEALGYSYREAGASLFLLFRQAVSKRTLPFTVSKYNVVLAGDGSLAATGTSDECTATVKLRMGKKEFHAVADGDGPVNALDSALRKALARSFPKLKQVQLVDYQVRIIKDRLGSAAKTRVLIGFRLSHRRWTTIGVGPNVIKASLKALIDGLEYALLS
ncbi:MAG: citramalate synthase [Candidatus Taylorbacteria bacterium]|nr:citramalate synthase [Candidatus Taylorbacteria bacterium]